MAAAFWLNSLWHTSQLYGFSPVWINMWRLSECCLVNFLKQTGHWGMLRSSLYAERKKHTILWTEQNINVLKKYVNKDMFVCWKITDNLCTEQNVNLFEALISMYIFVCRYWKYKFKNRTESIYEEHVYMWHCDIGRGLSHYRTLLLQGRCWVIQVI